jgi:hypothetical protein
MSIVLASLGAGAAAGLEALAAGYVLVLAIAGPVLMRYPALVDTLARRLTRRPVPARAI